MGCTSTGDKEQNHPGYTGGWERVGTGVVQRLVQVEQAYTE